MQNDNYQKNRCFPINFFSKIIIFLNCLICYFQAQSLHAQNDSLLIITAADSVYITAARMPAEKNRLPFSVSTLDKAYITKGQQRLSLKESLDYIPGVLSMNAENYTQDLRISIRGFGARAAFGIRGIKILVDGVPETTPDGQGQLDNLDINALTGMEVLRGPVAGLYGNASGGVISLNTMTDDEPKDFQFYAGMGTYGFKNLHLKSEIQKGKWSSRVQATHIRTEGYRNWNSMENTIMNASVTFKPDETNRISLIINHAKSPVANDAGGLTLEETTVDRKSAAPQNLRFSAGESVKQSKAAIRWLANSNNLSSELNVWYIFRDFENALPFRNGGIVVLRRHFPGFNAKITYKSTVFNIPWTVSSGIDAEFQKDERSRLDNLDGIKGGTQVFRQDELFNNTGLYIFNNFTPLSGLDIGISIRRDMIQIRAVPFDKAAENTNYQAFNPSLGINYKISNGLHVFANHTSNFESPALTELSNNPSGGTGFNSILKPQTARSNEVGIKWQKSKKIESGISLYRIQVENEILPYELAAFPQRLFYRNAGNTVRKGFEASINIALTEKIRLYQNYTYADYRYEQYLSGNNDFKNNRPPVQPVHQFFTDFRYYTKSAGYVILNFRYQSAMFADDANSVIVPGYGIIHLKAGKELKFKKLTAEPNIGIQNLSNTLYYNNVRINAAAGRYYEPAQERNLFASVKLSF